MNGGVIGFFGQLRPTIKLFKHRVCYIGSMKSPINFKELEQSIQFFKFMLIYVKYEIYSKISDEVNCKFHVNNYKLYIIIITVISLYEL
jgi:hypothetical protein